MFSWQLKTRVIVVIVFTAIVASCGVSMEQQLANAQSQVADRDFTTAVITLKNLLRDDPENIMGRLLLAQVSLALADPLAAEKELARARDFGANVADHMPLYLDIQLAIGKFAHVLELLALDTGIEGITAVESLRYRGEALLGLGSAIEAEKTFREAAALDSGSPDVDWGVAASLAALGRRDDANEATRSLTTTYPAYARGWLLKGQVALRYGESKFAEADFAIAADLAANTPDRLIEILARSGLADSQLSQNKLEDAEKSIRRLGNLTGPAPMTLFLIGGLAAARGDYELAANELERVLKIAPDNLRAALLYGSVLVVRGDYAQAEVVLSKVVSRAPENLGARRLLAAAQVELSEHRSAVETIAPLLEAGEADSNLALFAGQAMMHSGLVENAIQLLEESLIADPENTDIKLSLAAAYLQIRRPDKAIQLAESVPGDAESFRKELLLALAYAASDRNDEAERRIEEIIERFGDDSQALALTGEFYFQREKYAESREFFARALKIDATNTPARMGLGRIEGVGGNNELAAEHFEAVLKDDPQNVIALTSLATLAALDEDWESSQQLLLRAVAANDNSVSPRIMLARSYQRQGNLLRAEQTAQEAARLGADDASTQLSVGNILVAIGKYREALPYLRLATELSPRSAGGWYGLARAQLSLGERAEARASLNRALEIEPDSLRVSLVLALVEIRDGNMERALRIAAELKTKHPDSSAPINLEANIYMLQKRFDEATRLFRRAFEMAPSGALARRALQAAQQANLDDSDIVLKRWVDENPEDTANILYLAQYNGRAGAWSEATELYDRALENDANNYVALNNIAWAYFETGDDRAEKFARKAYQLRPEVGAVADTLGWILIKNGKLAEGMSMIEEAAVKSPDSANIRYHLAYVKNENGVLDESFSILRKLLETSDDFTERENAENLLRNLEAR